MCLAPGESGFEMIIEVGKLFWAVPGEHSVPGLLLGSGSAPRGRLEVRAAGVCTPGEEHQAWTPDAYRDWVFLEDLNK